MRRTLSACAIAAALFLAPVSGHAATTKGLERYGSGSAAYYDQSFDFGGWERIRRVQAANYGLAADQVYDPDGFYCVRIGSLPGQIITLRNADTGVTATCMVADTNAPQDNAVWRSRWVVETSYNLFRYLGLNGDNRVEVWMMPGSI